MIDKVQETNVEMSAQEGEQSSSSSASSSLLELRVQQSIRREMQRMVTSSSIVTTEDAGTKDAGGIYNVLLIGLKIVPEKLLDKILGQEDGGVVAEMVVENLDKTLLRIMITAKSLLIEKLSSLTPSQVNSIIGMEYAGVTYTIG